MKDNRFIELLNLYVDRQITAAETTELESELQANPPRRAVYRHYCQMHRATALVYESFRADNPGSQPALAVGTATIARFENGARPLRTSWIYGAGGLAAACLALVFVRMNSSRPAEADLAAAAKPTPPVAVAVMKLPVAPALPTGAGFHLVTLRNSSLATEKDYAAMLEALRLEERRAYADRPVQSGRLPSLFGDGVFDSQQLLPGDNQRAFRSRQTPTEQVSYTFQR